MKWHFVQVFKECRENESRSVHVKNWSSPYSLSKDYLYNHDSYLIWNARFRRNCTSNQNCAYFVRYLKNYQHVFECNTSILKQIVRETKNGIKISVGKQAVLELRLIFKKCKILFWSIGLTQLLIFSRRHWINLGNKVRCRQGFLFPRVVTYNAILFDRLIIR